MIQVTVFIMENVAYHHENMACHRIHHGYHNTKAGFHCYYYGYHNSCLGYHHSYDGYHNVNLGHKFRIAQTISEIIILVMVFIIHVVDIIVYTAVIIIRIVVIIVWVAVIMIQISAIFHFLGRVIMLKWRIIVIRAVTMHTCSGFHYVGNGFHHSS